MDAFIRENKSFLLSLVFLMAGLFALGYTVFYRPAQVAAADLSAMTGILNGENNALRAALVRAQQAATDPTQEAQAITSLPNFLRHINDIAKNTMVVIRELRPTASSTEAGPDIAFRLSLTADYLTFLRFAAALESLNVVINDLQVRPYDSTKQPPEHAIAFTITPRANARPLTGDRLKAIKAAVEQPDKRNPFQRFVIESETLEVRREIELTHMHRLSGIGRIGADRTATIDDRTYREGDTFKNMTITEIQGDRVRLVQETPDGSTRPYILKFRSSGIQDLF